MTPWCEEEDMGERLLDPADAEIIFVEALN
jgi:hypothetical protein